MSSDLSIHSRSLNPDAEIRVREVEPNLSIHARELQDQEIVAEAERLDDLPFVIGRRAGDIFVPIEFTDSQKERVNQIILDLQEKHPNIHSFDLKEQVIRKLDENGVLHQEPVFLDHEDYEPVQRLVDFIYQERLQEAASITRRYKDVKGSENAKPALLPLEARDERHPFYERILSLSSGPLEEKHKALIPSEERIGSAEIQRRLLAVRLWQNKLKELVQNRLQALANNVQEANDERIKSGLQYDINHYREFLGKLERLDSFAIEFAITHPYTNLEEAKKDLEILQGEIKASAKTWKGSAKPASDYPGINWVKTKFSSPSQELEPFEREYAIDVAALSIASSSDENAQDLAGSVLAYNSFIQDLNANPKKDSLEEALIVRNVEALLAGRSSRFNLPYFGIRGYSPILSPNEDSFFKNELQKLEEGFIDQLDAKSLENHKLDNIQIEIGSSESDVENASNDESLGLDALFKED